MGCQCNKPEESNEEVRADQIQIKDLEKENDLAQNNNNLSSRSHNGKPDDKFSLYLFNQINELRENPQSFIDIIEKAKSHITLDKSGIKVYKTSVKVALNKGEAAFDETIEILKKTKPMKKLKFNPDFLIEIPNNEVDVKSKEYLTDQVRLKLDAGVDVKSFWKDIVKDPESCFILTLVDDSGKNPGNKRNDILNKDNKYIGISTARVGRSFACYIVLG
jgi:hypothetical protein